MFARAFAEGLEGRYVEGNAPDVFASEPTRYGGEIPTTIGANAPQPYAPVVLRSRVNPWLAVIAALALVGVFAAVLANLRLPTGATSGPDERSTIATQTGLVFAPTATLYPPTSTTAPGGPTPTPYPPTATPNLTPIGGGGVPTPTNTPVLPTPTNTPVPTFVISASAGQSTDGQSFPGNLTIMAGAYATASAWSGGGGGVAQFSAAGTVQIDGVLTMNGKGYRGGPALAGAGGGKQGESYSGVGSVSFAANGGGGGGGDGADSGGAGGGFGSQGQNGHDLSHSFGGDPYGDPTISSPPYLGSGGGSSGAQSGAVGGAGGNGGGAIRITAGVIIVNGTISVNGVDGSSQLQFPGNYRGGGGGSGGSVWLHANTISLGSNRVTALGGNGGYGIFDGSADRSGGAGGVGRIRVEYTQTVSGSTNPAASVAHM